MYQVDEFIEVKPTTSFTLTVLKFTPKISLEPSTKLVTLEVIIGQSKSVFLRQYYTYPVLKNINYVFSYSYKKIDGEDSVLVQIDSAYRFVVSGNDISLAGEQANFLIVATTSLPNQVQNEEL